MLSAGTRIPADQNIKIFDSSGYEGINIQVNFISCARSLLSNGEELRHKCLNFWYIWDMLCYPTNPWLLYVESDQTCLNIHGQM